MIDILVEFVIPVVSSSLVSVIFMYLGVFLADKYIERKYKGRKGFRTEIHEIFDSMLIIFSLILTSGLITLLLTCYYKPYFYEILK